MTDYFIKDNWATNILGINSYISKKNEGFDEYQIKDFNNNLDQDAFLTLKVSTKNINDILLLQKLGFKVVDTLIQYSINPKYFNANYHKKIDKSEFLIEPAVSNEKEDIANLAYKEFKFSRFHLDPFFSDSLASKLKYSWVMNYFNGNRGNNWISCANKSNQDVSTSTYSNKQIRISGSYIIS